ncbi:hypothetical protein ACFWBH_07515 [Streptomyces sp. NPDC059999]|uniref:hypothetical protein n=1 Tax=Streptomyces sp. NPDC059999 TaxID=3347030 RepID=UPI0036B61A4D
MLLHEEEADFDPAKPAAIDELADVLGRQALGGFPADGVTAARNRGVHDRDVQATGADFLDGLR